MQDSEQQKQGSASEDDEFDIFHMEDVSMDMHGQNDGEKMSQPIEKWDSDFSQGDDESSGQ
jgi:hypothetical protein